MIFFRFENILSGQDRSGQGDSIERQKKNFSYPDTAFCLFCFRSFFLELWFTAMPPYCYDQHIYTHNRVIHEFW
jgi:hypothetical protein